jgi:hypothetical protein
MTPGDLIAAFAAFALCVVFVFALAFKVDRRDRKREEE